MLFINLTRSLTSLAEINPQTMTVPPLCLRMAVETHCLSPEILYIYIGELISVHIF